MSMRHKHSNKRYNALHEQIKLDFYLNDKQKYSSFDKIFGKFSTLVQIIKNVRHQLR